MASANQSSNSTLAPPYPPYLPVLTLIESLLTVGVALIAMSLIGRLLYFVNANIYRLRVKQLSRSMLLFLAVHSAFCALTLPYHVYVVLAWSSPAPNYDPYTLFYLGMLVSLQVVISPIPTMYLAIERIMSLRVQWANDRRLSARLFIAVCAFFVLVVVADVAYLLSLLPLDVESVKGCLNLACIEGQTLNVTQWVKNTLETLNVIFTACFIRMLHRRQMEQTSGTNAYKQERMVKNRLVTIVLIVQICCDAVPMYTNYVVQLLTGISGTYYLGLTGPVFITISAAIAGAFYTWMLVKSEGGTSFCSGKQVSPVIYFTSAH